MGDHQGLHVVEAVLDEAQIREDQVDTGLIVSREQHPAVHDQQPAQMLENRHVAADFADATQRCDPQSSGGQRPRWREFLVHWRNTVAARISAANASMASGEAGTCGSRGSPASKPCSLRPSLANVTPPSRACAAASGPRVTLILRAVATSPELNADNISRS